MREDPRDALVGRGGIGWEELPRGATVATSSLRRRAQLLRLRPDIRVNDVRGNVDTRLGKLDAQSGWAAILLACAGLVRLGLEHRISERLVPELFLPAPGQGALAVTARSDDPESIAAARDAIHHLPTACAVTAERAFLRRLEGGCQVPVAALGELDTSTGRLSLRGRVVSLEGEESVEGVEEGQSPTGASGDSLGTALAERLLGLGAAEILASVRAASPAGVPEP